MKRFSATLSLGILLAPALTLAQYVPPDYFNDAYKTAIGFWPDEGQVIDTDGFLVPSG